MKLKPCPFCGSTKVGYCSYERKEDEPEKKLHFIQCHNCKAMASDSGFLATYYSVAEKWNTRVIDKETKNG